VTQSERANHNADVIVDGTSDDVDLFLWGRMPATNPRILLVGDTVPALVTALRQLAA
jgi:hypothetical protein